MTRAARALLGVGAAVVLAFAASGCGTSTPAAAPTADPFSGLTERSDQAFREGLEAYGQGQYREALNAFDRARLLSPTNDPRIIQMLERARAQLVPTPTPVPSTPTSVPVAPTPVAIPMSALQPDSDLGLRYFGQVALVVVPGRDTVAKPSTQFFFQDQIGLRIEGLKQHLRLPLTLRVFNTETASLVAEVRNDELSTTPVATSVPAPVSRPLSPAQAADRPASQNAGPSLSLTPIDPSANLAPVSPTDFKVTRFWDNYVWYHEGGERPGRYRAELYANGTLTHIFDYSVANVPVAVAEEPAPTAVVEPTPIPLSEPELDLPPVVIPVRPAPAPVAAAPVVAPPEPTATPQPTPVPPTPTPATAASTLVGGLPAGLDVNTRDGRVVVADGSGVVWTTDPARLSFNRPFNLERLPVDLAVDQTTGNAFVSARNAPAITVVDPAGRTLKTIELPVTPGDLQIDSDLGLLYVVLPERQALGVVDMRAGRLLRTVPGMPQITSLALDTERHVLYASHLGGQVTSIDVPSSQITGRVGVTGAGLAGVATARGQAYTVNTATKELAIVEPVSQAVTRFTLVDEPSAVAASEASGAVYVLTTRPVNSIVRIDPTNGAEIGRVLLPQRSGRFGMTQPGQGEFQGLRARLVLNRVDESVYVTLPEAGTLSVVPSDQFPVLAYEIPSPDLGDTATAEIIPGVLLPASAALPDAPAATLRGQASIPQNSEEAK
jgi:DNA-binding beta-propeller fold protein YncE